MDNTNGVETESNCSYEETAAKIESALRKNLKLSEESSNRRKYEEKEWILPDVTQLPGYQPVPSNCPAWKVNMIEKKNQQLEDDARRKLIAQREEENRWKDIPEWKRNLIMEKEKRKVAPLEAERRKREEEMAKLQSMPDWKRDLILKKRGDQ
ncbi:hypothetical protein LSH36_621g00003 [Paralvinella palmiformis]|uniref:Uncharacterized protein n=1 Tax=Paralvinella palmiformis TaxID=53620 RepID=A0AAD9J416_9ANNE|nr:hypothetical protein LSH36_621g00003 [Paralvinella palmiformis]